MGEQKKYKERSYDVIIGPTTYDGASSIDTYIRVGLETSRANMRLVNDEITTIYKDGVYLLATIRYGARGNCPYDIRRKIYQLINPLNTYVSVFIKPTEL